MPITRDQKADVVADLKRQFSEAAATVFVQYQGLNVAALTHLRRRCREAGVDFVVRKNTLALRAARALDVEGAEAYFVGPTAFAFHAEDPTAAARVLQAFAKEAPVLELKGGLLAGRVLDKAAVERLANVPAREQLLSMVARALQAPIGALARSLNAIPTKLALALAAVRDQKQAAAG